MCKSQGTDRSIFGLRVDQDKPYDQNWFDRSQSAQSKSGLTVAQSAHRLAVLGYLLYFLGIVFGITAVFGVIVNHTHLAKTKHTIAFSHCLWQIVSFWVLFAGVVATVIMWSDANRNLMAFTCLIWWLSTNLIGVWFLLKGKSIPGFSARVSAEDKAEIS